MPTQSRCRINVTISTKGVKTWDCTAEIIVDGEVVPCDASLKASDYLVEALEARYPITIEEKSGK